MFFKVWFTLCSFIRNLCLQSVRFTVNKTSAVSISLGLNNYKISQSWWVLFLIFQVLMSLVLDIWEISQAQLVLVLAYTEFYTLDKSQHRKFFRYYSQAKFILCGVNNFCFSLDNFLSQSQHWDSHLGLSLIRKTLWIPV